ncbi:hypothetical protein BN189_4530001 [Clostridioides difficile T10]|nr:hypothetical protein BN189_4530001 [Clostridioides difficile T10]
MIRPKGGSLIGMRIVVILAELAKSRLSASDDTQ